jgi:hypothetical protein
MSRYGGPNAGTSFFLLPQWHLRNLRAGWLYRGGGVVQNEHHLDTTLPSRFAFLGLRLNQTPFLA